MSAAKHESEKLQEKLPILEGLDDSEDFEDEEQPEDEYVWDVHDDRMKQDPQTGEWR